MNSISNPNIKGVDISMWQNPVDFNELKNGGFDVVIIKATEGVNYVDPQFINHYNGAIASGIKVGMYHFMSDATDPTEQAQDFWNSIKDKKYDVIPVLDLEKETKGRNKTQVTDRAVAFLEEFKRLSGLDCIVYSYTGFIKEYVDTRLSNYKLWIAEYGVVSPGENGIWNSWVGFQYSESASVKGLPTNGDADVFCKEIFLSNPGSDVVEEVATPGAEVEKPLWELCINGSLVECLQEQLNEQCGASLDVDGYFGESTLDSCCIVKESANGQITKIIQERLLQIGYTSLASCGGADGNFGVGTTTAVEHLQSNRGITVDGVVGKETWRQLFLKR